MDGKPAPIRSPYAPAQSGLPVSTSSQLHSAPHLPGATPYATPPVATLDDKNPASGDGEHFTIDIRQEYEERTTGDEAQKAMRDLLAGAIGAIDITDVDMNDAVVEGFNENITLMPHQIQGRAWMRERETGKKTGGILADVCNHSTSWFLSRLLLTL